MNPMGAENGVRIYEKINDESLVSLWVNKPNPLEAAWCAWRRNASLKNSAMAKLNELSNTMNMTSMLQGEDPPIVVQTGMGP